MDYSGAYCERNHVISSVLINGNPAGGYRGAGTAPPGVASLGFIWRRNHPKDASDNLISKATNPLHRQPDPEALVEFCKLVEKERDGPQVALRLLAHKIQSPQEKESLMALAVLEESVRNCGVKFRSEVGKFRFLNEMIKVVSPKYLGNRASLKVKQKIIELLFLWSMELKQETKIFEAYQMLKRQGVVSEDPVHILKNYEPPPPPPPRPKNAVFEDEEKARQLQRLLRSANPQDLQAANRLIKSMVQEADRRMELLAKRSTELETVHNNAKVLADMLHHYKSQDTSVEEKELMKELFESCERLRPKLFRLAGELDEKDEGLGDILKANDELTIVINQYKKIMGIETESNSIAESSASTKNVASLLDLGSPLQESVQSSSDTSLLDDQLLALGLADPPVKIEHTTAVSNTCDNSNSSSSLTDLGPIFTSCSNANDSLLNTTQSAVTLSSSLPLNVSTNANSHFINRISTPPNITCMSSLLPVMTDAKTLAIKNMSDSQEAKCSTSNPALKALEELDALGQTLLKNSLPAASVLKVDFPSSSPQKIPLSQLKQQAADQKSIDSELISITPKSNNEITAKSSAPASPAHEAGSLSDIFVPLETIQPGSLQPLTLLEKNGLTVVIHFGKNNPRPDVSVMVISTMSKNSSPVKSVSFQAAVPKSMKIRLQPPSAIDLPAHNPILPPAAITQVLLLSNPQKEKVRLKYKITYTINEEEYTDVGEIDSLFNSR